MEIFEMIIEFVLKWSRSSKILQNVISHVQLCSMTLNTFCMMCFVKKKLSRSVPWMSKTSEENETLQDLHQFVHLCCIWCPQFPVEMWTQDCKT